MRYILSIICVLTLVACNRVPLEYRLQYFYTSEERAILDSRIEEEIKQMPRGSLILHSKLDTLIALNPESEPFYTRKALSYTNRGQFQKAFPLIEKSVRLDPANALYHSCYQMLFTFRDYKRALEDLEFYDDITPGLTYVWGENVNYLKGLALKQLGRYDEAVEAFSQCIYEEGRNASEYDYVYRGIANLRHECLEDAASDFAFAIEQYKNCTMAYVYMGETKIRQQDYEEAMGYLSKAEELLCRGIKYTHPYFEVFDEVQLDQIYDLMSMCQLEL